MVSCIQRLFGGKQRTGEGAWDLESFRSELNGSPALPSLTTLSK